MADNVAGQYGGYNNQWIWLVWVALIALIIYVFCFPSFGIY